MITEINSKIDFTKKWTYDAYRNLDDDRRYEIIEGELLMAPAPNLYHQKVSRNLEFLLHNYVKEKGLGEIFYAPVDVILDSENVVQPDIVFVSKKRSALLQHGGIMGSPDVSIEIISPSSTYRDHDQKKLLYQNFGVNEYWIVDPANRVIEIFVLVENIYQLHQISVEKGLVKSKMIDGFEFELSEIFDSETYE